MAAKKKASAGRTKRTSPQKGTKSAAKKVARKRPARRSGAKKVSEAFPWADRFIDALQATRSVTKACEAIGIGRTTVYQHRDRDDDFRSRWEEARYTFRDDLEASTLEWAIDGLKEPVFARVEVRDDKGRILESSTQVVGVKIAKNAAVTLRMLECLYPERYGRDQGDSDPHEAARIMREDLMLMAGGVPTAPPAGQSAHLVEPLDPDAVPAAPGQAEQVDATGQVIPQPLRRAQGHEPEPPP